MTLTRLHCAFCGDPIRKQDRDPDSGYTAEVDVTTGLERAWHTRCAPDYAPADSPFQAAVQKAKQAISDAQRLSPEEFEEFLAIVGLALERQRR